MANVFEKVQRVVKSPIESIITDASGGEKREIIDPQILKTVKIL